MCIYIYGELFSFFAPWMEDHHVNLLAVDIDARFASKNYTAANVAADMAAGKAGMSSQDSEDEGSSGCWPFEKTH